MRGRTVYAAAIAVAIVAIACESEVAPNVATSIRGEPLDAIVQRLEPSDVDIVAGFEAMVPANIPETGVALVGFPLGRQADPESRPSELFVGQIRSHPNDISILCATAQAAIPCSDESDTWRISLSESQGAIVPIASSPTGNGVGVIIALAGDIERPQVASRAFWAQLPTGSEVGEATELVHTPVLGGCGFAVLVEDLAVQDTFTPRTLFDPNERIYLVVQTCADTVASAIYPLLLVDNDTIISLSATPEHTGWAIDAGATYVVALERSIVRSASLIQAFVLPDGTGDAWVTWPATIAR